MNGKINYKGMYDILKDKVLMFGYSKEVSKSLSDYINEGISYINDNYVYRDEDFKIAMGKISKLLIMLVGFDEMEKVIRGLDDVK